MNVLEMKCWRSLVGVSSMDRVMNQAVRRRAEIGREFARRVDQRVLRWFGHVKRMYEYRMARWVLMAEVVSGGRVQARQAELMLDGWCDGSLGQQRNDSGGSATMRERYERIENHGAHLTD